MRYLTGREPFRVSNNEGKTLKLSIQQLECHCSQFEPRKKWYRYLSKRAAVAIILRDMPMSSGGVEVLMIKRAVYEGDPWSGDMAFPGGRVDKVDSNSLMAARRETLEEIGLNTHDTTAYITRLSDVKARAHTTGRRPLVITPYLFKAESLPEPVLNEEVEEVVWIPLSFFMDKGNRQTMVWKRKKIRRELPCYYFAGRKIWGLSLMMLDELVFIFSSEA